MMYLRQIKRECWKHPLEEMHYMFGDIVVRNP